MSCLGHGDPDVIAAIQHQAEQLAFSLRGFFISGLADLERVYLVSGDQRLQKLLLNWRDNIMWIVKSRSGNTLLPDVKVIMAIH